MASHRVAGRGLAGFPNEVAADLDYDPAGQLTSMTYTHPAGNRTSVSSNGGVQTYVFDDLNRLIEATAGGVTTSWTYDPAGNELTETISGDVC